MGTGLTAKKKGIRSKKKQYKRSVWLCRRDKDIDQIQDEFEKAMEQHNDKNNTTTTTTTTTTGSTVENSSSTSSEMITTNTDTTITNDKEQQQLQQQKSSVVPIKLNLDTIPIASTIIAQNIEFNDELPGCGQYYCSETSKHFISQKALDDHKRTKFYKKRMKQLQQEKYTQHTADWASGLTKEILPPAHTK